MESEIASQNDVLELTALRFSEDKRYGQEGTLSVELRDKGRGKHILD